MKKTVCKVISVIMCTICICAIVLCVKVFSEPTHGFIDFSSLAYAVYGGVGIVSAIIAFVTGKIGWKSKPKE